jgi:hypothetical protein
MAEQYTLGYALVAALVFLGFLVVCVPRPRRPAFKDEATEEKHYAELKKKSKKSKKGKQRNKRS